jgi:putative YphP/YqiW family bacilliredoxin
MFENTGLLPPIYDPTAVQPMRDELTWVGFEELLTPEDVDRAVRETEGTLLVVINSVCGCAAGSARPAVALALQHKTIPDRLTTVFAGQDREATARVREYLVGYPPSSPSMALLKDGKVLFMMERHHIEGRAPEEIARVLTRAFDEFCDRQGPSIPPEKYEQLVHAKACGSSIPRVSG